MTEEDFIPSWEDEVPDLETGLEEVTNKDKLLEEEPKKDRWFDPDPHNWKGAIIIDEYFVATHDKWCWTLHQKAEKGEYYRQSYHVTLPQAFKHYVKTSLNRLSTIDDILSHLEKIEAKIDVVFKNIKTL